MGYLKRGIWILIILTVILDYPTMSHSKVNSESDWIFGNNEEATVIVILKDDYNAVDNNIRKTMISGQQENIFNELKLKKKSKGVSAQAVSDYDFELSNTYTSLNGFAGKLKKSGYEKLRNNPKVSKIIKSGTKSIMLDSSVPQVNATGAWGLIYNGINITGKGESICVIDTGIDYTHPSLGGCTTASFLAGNCSKVIAGYDFINNDYDPMDDNVHGTHVAGIIASANSTYRGVAPNAALVALKVCNAAGSCPDNDIIAAIDWCVNNASKYNISVISMSLGGGLFTTYCDDEPSESGFKIAIDNAISRNISVIVSTGNDYSTNSIASPACIRNSTSVGSVTKSDVLSGFGNRNNITDLMAPGSSITSTAIKSGCLICDSSGFLTLSGTSMAAPHVAGAFALLHQYKLLEQNTILTPFQIQNALNSTGKQINDSGGNGISYPRINIMAALLSLDSTAPAINLVAPTPANNSNSSNSSFILNMTSNEILSQVILEFNSSNETVNATPIQLNWMINKSVSSFGIFNYRVYATDYAGNIMITPTFQIKINNTAPNITSFFPQEANASIKEPDNITFNASASDINGDAISFLWYQNGTLRSSNSYFTFIGNFSTAGLYNITAAVSDGKLESFQSWSLTVNNTNTPPEITSVNLTNTDFLNRTNGSLLGFWSFNDSEGDAITANETLWYVNNTKIDAYANKTSISPKNTTRLENWTFSVRVFDGSNWSVFVNSSSIRILNSKPSIITSPFSIEVLETQLVNITINASDLDNDALALTSNKSDFLISGNSLLWQTSLASSGTYVLNITVNDGAGTGSGSTDSINVNVTVADARDLDNDGNPDFNDSDMDNDGIPNNEDYFEGNSSSINTTLSLGIMINGTSNISKRFNGNFTINITKNSYELIEFNFTFGPNVLDLGNLTINATANGFSAVSIRGNLNLINLTKTVFLDKVNATVKSVCIKNSDSNFDSISSWCDSGDETFLVCNNSTAEAYTCFDTGSRYKITGLSHSAVKEQCRDSDGDGYGAGCSAGDDCNDNDKTKTNDCTSGSSSGSGGGSGGSGGGTVGFVCSMDWKCSEWSECENGLQSMQCNFVKVAQHVQDNECADSSIQPPLSRKCEIQRQIGYAEIINSSSEHLNRQNKDKPLNAIIRPNAAAAHNKYSGNNDPKLTGFSFKSLITDQLNAKIIRILFLSSIICYYCLKLIFFKIIYKLRAS